MGFFSKNKCEFRNMCPIPDGNGTCSYCASQNFTDCDLYQSFTGSSNPCPLKKRCPNIAGCLMSEMYDSCYIYKSLQDSDEESEEEDENSNGTFMNGLKSFLNDDEDDDEEEDDEEDDEEEDEEDDDEEDEDDDEDDDEDEEDSDGSSTKGDSFSISALFSKLKSLIVD